MPAPLPLSRELLQLAAVYPVTMSSITFDNVCDDGEESAEGADGRWWQIYWSAGDVDPFVSAPAWLRERWNPGTPGAEALTQLWRSASPYAIARLRPDLLRGVVLTVRRVCARTGAPLRGVARHYPLAGVADLDDALMDFAACVA